MAYKHTIWKDVGDEVLELRATLVATERENNALRDRIHFLATRIHELEVQIHHPELAEQSE